MTVLMELGNGRKKFLLGRAAVSDIPILLLNSYWFLGSMVFILSFGAQ